MWKILNKFAFDRKNENYYQIIVTKTSSQMIFANNGSHPSKLIQIASSQLIIQMSSSQLVITDN